MIRGLKPVKRKDPRFFDFHATFGTAQDLTKDFDFDTSPMPDQNADGAPNGCTSYLVTGIASNEDKIYYDDKRFTYENSKRMAGVQGEVPVDMETAFKSGTVYGVKTLLESVQDALGHRRGPYFIIRPLDNSYYDGLVSAMIVRNGSVGAGTVWLPSFEQIGSDGLIQGSIDPNQSFTSGHAWEIVGQKTINGERRIIGKSWQGPQYGDKGYCYFNKPQIDNLFRIRGSIALGQKDAAPEDIRKVQLDIFTTILFYIQHYLAKLIGV